MTGWFVTRAVLRGGLRVAMNQKLIREIGAHPASGHSHRDEALRVDDGQRTVRRFSHELHGHQTALPRPRKKTGISTLGGGPAGRQAGNPLSVDRQSPATVRQRKQHPDARSARSHPTNLRPGGTDEDPVRNLRAASRGIPEENPGTTLEERAESFSGLRADEGYLSECERGETVPGANAPGSTPASNLRIVEFHSPIEDLLRRFPILLRLEQELFARVLNCRVRREEAEAQPGFYRCTFHLG